jgi:hypothetical protein
MIPRASKYLCRTTVHAPFCRVKLDFIGQILLTPPKCWYPSYASAIEANSTFDIFNVTHIWPKIFLIQTIHETMQETRFNNYAHHQSSHPPAVLQASLMQLTIDCPNISSDEQAFDSACPPYEDVLHKSGCNYKLIKGVAKSARQFGHAMQIFPCS